jgi:Cu-Zn family superoxide dismutase
MRVLAGMVALAASVSATAQEPAGPSMVFFDWGKPDIRSDDATTLDKIAQAYRPGAELRIAGYADRSGSMAVNLVASRRRAEKVRAELARRGIPAEAMTIAAYGEARPLVSTEDGVREVQNRRVEIEVSGAGVSSTTMPVPFPITGPNGEPRGIATFFSDGQRTEIKVQAAGLPPGVHGIHLHAVGRCEGPDFKSAGGHWNPAGKQHGHDNPLGAHLGDLPNLTVGADGRGAANFSIQGDMADADGTSLVIHAQPDDNKTDPSGNSGDRIACAVLTTAEQP